MNNIKSPRRATPRQRWSMRLAIAGCMLLGAATVQPVHAADAPGAQPLKFKWGAPTGDYYPLYVAMELDLFRKHGLDPEFFWFPSGAPLLAGLKSGDIDVFTTGLATVFALGQKIPLTFISWEINDAAAAGLVVDPKSGIRDYRDIGRAKAIAAASGTCSQVALALLARKAGVPYKSLNVINIPPPLYANALKSASIDAGLAWAPYLQVLGGQGYKVANWDEDYTVPTGVCPVLSGARPEFLKAHPELGAKLIAIRAEALAAIDKNPDLAVKALAKRLSIPEAVAREVYARTSGSSMPSFEQQLAPDTPYSLTSRNGGLAAKLHLAGELLHEAGSIPAPLSWEQVNQAIDPSYIRQYLGQAKP
jgi:ABC-type nitrate/sulfonate/bicarbonate transport system substrate-binding protein